MALTGLVNLPPGVRSEHAPYLALGNHLRILNSRSRELLAEGPAGTGKTRTCLEKAFALCDQIPGFKVLHVRQTRESITNSTKIIFDEEVIPEGHGVFYHQGNMRYQFPNGSILVLAGLDNPGRAMSSQYHLIYWAEATEGTLEAWEMLSTRVSRAPGGAGWGQLLADCNPSFPTHWLNLRCQNRRTERVRTVHTDNPTCTPEYLATLQSLTGVRYKRLYLGEWAAAEGQIYDDWDEQIHLVNRFPVPEDWPRVWSVDFGYVDPFVWQCWAIRPADDAMFLVHEIYRTHVMVEDHCRTIRRVCSEWHEPAPRAVVCDWDAEGRATLERYLGVRTTPATKNIAMGIQVVQGRIRPTSSGKAKLYVVRDCGRATDPDLARDKRAHRTQDEFYAYEWDTTNNRRKGEVPADHDNHGMDASRYAAAYWDGLDSGPSFREIVIPVQMTRRSTWN